MSDLKDLDKFLTQPRSLEEISGLLDTKLRTTYRRLWEFAKKTPIDSVFWRGRACFVLASKVKSFDKKGKVRHKGTRGENYDL